LEPAGRGERDGSRVLDNGPCQILADDTERAARSYHDDVKQVDARQFPTYKRWQACSTCLQLQGAPGQPWRPCTIFPSKLVNANGWCKVRVKKA